MFNVETIPNILSNTVFPLSNHFSKRPTVDISAASGAKMQSFRLSAMSVISTCNLLRQIGFNKFTFALDSSAIFKIGFA